MFDPIRLSILTKNAVTDGKKRRYYRFRPSRFYGGIATADCNGCILRCVFAGREKNWPIPGNMAVCTPTIAREHLLEVLDRIPMNFLFILETNGILIGYEEGYAKELSRFPHLHVRVSLKGTTNEEFSRLTGAEPSGFEWQLKALENLTKEEVSCNPAVMISFSPPENVENLRKRLASIQKVFFYFEEEELILYPSVEGRLRRASVEYYSAYSPDNIPAEQI
jgi:uncharacterized Fe-S cluster-containing radical SAM superfamily protein